MSKRWQKRSGMRLAAMAGSLGLMAAIGAAQTESSGTGMTGMTTGLHQNSTTTSASTSGNTSLGPPGPIDVAPSPFPDTSRQKRNDERQKRLVIDTQKLLTLTSQLKAEVASTGAETMSPEMLKQMEVIEKLAKSVKDKMRD